MECAGGRDDGKPQVRPTINPQKPCAALLGWAGLPKGQRFYLLCLPLAGVHLQQAVNGAVGPDMPRHGADGLLCADAHHVGTVGASLHHSRKAGSCRAVHSGGFIDTGCSGGN